MKGQSPYQMCRDPAGTNNMTKQNENRQRCILKPLD